MKNIGIIKKYKPKTPGLRHKKRLIRPNIVVSWDEYAWAGLIKGRKNKTGGRNNQGKITVRGRGGGHKRRQRIVNPDLGAYSVFESFNIMTDPSRTAPLIGYGPVRNYELKEMRWFAPLPEEDIVIAKGPLYPKIAPYLYPQIEKGEYYNDCITLFRKPLRDYRPGELVHNIGNIFVLAAGTSARVLRTQGSLTTIVLPSGKTKVLSADTLATPGAVGYGNRNKEVIGKAGTNRRLGWRPIVRGTARNPVDHPHGGKTHGSGGKGKPAKNVWGKLAKNKK